MLPSGLSFPEVLKRNNKEHKRIFRYGTITLYGIPFQEISPNQLLSKCSPSGTQHIKIICWAPDVIFLQPRTHNKLCIRFGLFPFRSPLLRECASVKHWHCFLFLRVLRCFTSPGSRLTFLMSRLRFTQSGFPIRKSPDQRLLNTSPKLIAVTPRPSSPPTPKASTICP